MSHYLCYPSSSEDCVRGRLEELRTLGVVEVLNLLGKGHAAVVLEARLSNGTPVAVKVLRVDSKRTDLTAECRVAELAYPVSPKVYSCSEEFIVMELVRGYPAVEVLASEGFRYPYVVKVLAAGRWLDVRGVDHRELSRAHKHVVIDRTGAVRILDYESAAVVERPCNICRLFSWLARLRGVDVGVLGEVLTLLRYYKKAEREDLRRELFKEILRSSEVLSAHRESPPGGKPPRRINT
jgi:putative serine/threonine protein kinase